MALGAGSATMLAAQTAPPVSASVAEAAQAAPGANTVTIRGRITDPDGALIPGAKVTVNGPDGKAVATTTADSGGNYEIRNLKPGSYTLIASFAGFAPFQSQPIAIAAGQAKHVDIKMAIQVEQQNVVVTDEAPTVNTDASGNTSAIVLKGKDLDALSDDPDELSNELQALAGPSAGPNGGQVYIDGFTGGQLPPKSAIREIRINQNPFSAEFDKLGYGRIEILTKPGTDKLHGQFFVQGNDSSFNTGNPFAKNTPAYDSYQFNGTINGSMSKWASFFISAEQRNTSDAYVYSATLNDAGEVETGGVYSPRVRTNIAPRIDLQLGSKNTLTMRYQFYRNAQSGILGSTISLPTQATGSTAYEHTIQISDSEVINDHLVNETRFQYLRDLATDTSVSAAPMITVPTAFTGGGATAQYSNDHQDHLEFWNETTLTAGAHAIKFGTRLRDYRDANTTNGNFNGTFNFSSITSYTTLQNDLASGMTFAQIAASPDCVAGNSSCALPNKLTYTTGGLQATVNMFDAALFFQDDWKVNKNLTLSGGLRWESQNHVADHSDWDPRVAFAYALDGHKKGAQTKTVLRGGYGIFYDRLPLADLLSATHQSGAAGSQVQVAISNPTCFSSTSLSSIDLSSCGTATSSSKAIVQIAPNYTSPSTQQFAASLERQLTKTTTLTGTYLHSYGVHQLVQRNSNAYLPGTYLYGSPTLTGVRPNPNLGIVDQYYTEAVFKQHQVIVNVNARLTPNFSVVGFYNWTHADSDGGAGSNPSNSYDLKQDYGRASFAADNMVFLMGNYVGPFGIRFTPFMIAQSGKPYNVVTANDLTGDNFFNNRPELVDSSNCSGTTLSAYVPTQFGCLDTAPSTSAYTPIKAYMGNGPAAVAVNLRLSRSFGIGPKVEGNGNNQQHGGGPGGGPGGGGGGGRGGGGAPGGGLGPGGLGGGGGRGGMFGGGQAGTGRKYTLTFTAQALNLFNNVDYGLPSGTVVPTQNLTTGAITAGPKFGVSQSLASGIFTSPTSSSVRRIFVQAMFSF
jgi:hypothetical protein